MNAARVQLALYGGGALVLGVVLWRAWANKESILEAGRGVVTDTIAAVTPTNPDNIFAKAANAVARTVTGGDGGTTAGNAAFEILHPGAVAAERAAIYGTPSQPVTSGNWQDTLGAAWESATAESARQNQALANSLPGGAAVGIFPGMK